jgi:uncharacterized protein (TIGR02466 family)
MKLISNIPIIANNIFIYKLDINNDFTENFKQADYFQTPNNLKTYQSKNKNILQTYPILQEEINKSVKDVIYNMYKYDCNFFITSSWLTRTLPSGISDDHCHSNNWLSGIYYPDYDPSFQTEFYNDYKDTFHVQPKEYNMFNSWKWTITPNKNTLIIFSSRLRHKALENKSSRDRYSLAFNLLPNGVFGNDDSQVNFNLK